MGIQKHIYIEKCVCVNYTLIYILELNGIKRESPYT